MLESESESSLLQSLVTPPATCDDNPACSDVTCDDVCTCPRRAIPACDEPLGSVVVAGALAVKAGNFALCFCLIVFVLCFRLNATYLWNPRAAHTSTTSGEGSCMNVAGEEGSSNVLVVVSTPASPGVMFAEQLGMSTSSLHCLSPPALTFPSCVGSVAGACKGDRLLAGGVERGRRRPSTNGAWG